MSVEPVYGGSLHAVPGDPVSAGAHPGPPGGRPEHRRATAGRRVRALATRLAGRPELLGLIVISGALNLWNLSVNGWANTYYSAAVRSMSASWHNFLFASMDPRGLMTVDKPPLALWIQALSARIFGLHPLAVLVPQALMGVGATLLVYDLTRRRFGRSGAFAAGLALATTPIIVAVSRHNNPDALLVLCCTAAVWAALRALEAGRTRWLVLSAVCVGLGFETKMLVAFMVVPGIVLAWLWAAPLDLRMRVRRLAGAGVAGTLVAGAWPLLVMLTPSADRPWISGTSDNSIWSLVFGYNGLGRVAGQAGGPGGLAGRGAGPGGGSAFGGPTGPFRLLQSGLGDQAGWLLGFALVAGIGLIVLTRLRRRDPRTGWLIVVGGALACSALVFSFAQGIFHPYYVSFFAPFTAALVGAGVALMLGRGGLRGRRLRAFAALALAGGVVTEAVVLGGLGGQLGWATAALALVGAAAVALVAVRPSRLRATLVGAAVAGLLAAPAAWAVQTLGHAESSTFPAGGSAQADGFGGPPGGRFGRRFGGGFGRGGSAGVLGRGAAGGPPGGAGGLGLAGPGGPGSAGVPGGPGQFPAGGFPRSGGLGGGGMFGGDSADLQAAIVYARAHGGGTIGVESQSSAAQAILTQHADVAGLGGFSGRESSVSVQWLARAVGSGRLRWLLAGSGGAAGLPGDSRTGSGQAIATAARACRAVTLTTTATTLYDCAGRASAIAARAG